LKSLRIGTRASALARWQAESVQAQLAALGCTAELVLIRTSGDQDRQTPLRMIGGKGVFTKEIEAALLEDRVDLAVHSMKDLPTTLPAGLVLVQSGDVKMCAMR
jgi:hydroxymethylbilane synthase